MTPELTLDQLYEMSAEALVEHIAQVLYDKAQYASEAEDEAVTDAIKAKYNTQMQTYCAAAETVRALVRE